MTKSKSNGRAPELVVLRPGDRVLAAIETAPGEIVAYRLGEVTAPASRNGRGRLTPAIAWGAEIPADVLAAVSEVERRGVSMT